MECRVAAHKVRFAPTRLARVLHFSHLRAPSHFAKTDCLRLSTPDSPRERLGRFHFQTGSGEQEVYSRLLQAVLREDDTAEVLAHSRAVQLLQ